MQTVNIYTISGIKRPGRSNGVGAYTIQLDGSDEHTVKEVIRLQNETQQSAELTLLIEAIRRIHTRVNIRIYTENAGVAAAFINGWVQRWERNGWQRKPGIMAKNAALWERLLADTRAIEIDEKEIEWHIKEPHGFRLLMTWETGGTRHEQTKRG